MGSAESTDTLTRPQPSRGSRDGDHELFSHIIRRPAGVTIACADYVTFAIIEGVEIESLCGKKWIPSRIPENFPVCSSCKEVLAGL